MTSNLHPNRLFRLGAVLLATLVLLAPGCMYSPYKDQIYASRFSTVSFNGFVATPNSLVEIYVQSWPKGDCSVVGTETAWEFLGHAYSVSTATVDWKGNQWYQFHHQAVIPTANWCLVPAGVGGTPGGWSYKTHVYARYRLGNTWFNLGTVDKNFISCAQQQGGDGWKMYNNCRTGSVTVPIWAHP